MAEQTKNNGSRDDDVFYVRLRFEDRSDALRFNSDYKFDVIDTSIDDKIQNAFKGSDLEIAPERVNGPVAYGDEYGGHCSISRIE